MINDKLTKELQEQITENKTKIEYIEDSLIYSTNEVNTNKKWIDGKPIYRKCYKQTGNLTNINTGMLDIDDVISLVVMIKGVGTNGIWRTIPWCFNNNTYEPSYTGGAYFKSNEGLIGFQAGNGLTTNDKSIIIIEYTKTTN